MTIYIIQPPTFHLQAGLVFSLTAVTFPGKQTKKGRESFQERRNPRVLDNESLLHRLKMTQSGKLMPNLDQQSTKMLNLTVLQRIDPFIEEILITAAHVTFYEFNIETNQWVSLKTCYFVVVQVLFIA